MLVSLQQYQTGSSYFELPFAVYTVVESGGPNKQSLSDYFYFQPFAIIMSDYPHPAYGL